MPRDNGKPVMRSVGRRIGAVLLALAAAAITSASPSCLAADLPVAGEAARAELEKVSAGQIRFALQKDFHGLQPYIRAVVTNGSAFGYSTLQWRAELFLDGAAQPVASTDVYDIYKDEGGLKAGEQKAREFHVGFVSGDPAWTTLEVQNAKQRTVKLSLLPEAARDFGDRPLLQIRARAFAPPGVAENPVAPPAREDERFFSSALSALPVVLIATVFAVAYFLRRRRLAQSFAWYRQQYPQLVSPDGRVRCHQCGGGQVGTERLMNHSYLRRHLCRSCGTTLYYSPEE